LEQSFFVHGLIDSDRLGPILTLRAASLSWFASRIGPPLATVLWSKHVDAAWGARQSRVRGLLWYGLGDQATL